MNRVKFYVYSSNIAIMLFGIIFMIMGVKNVSYVFIGLGFLLTVYGIVRFYYLRQAYHKQEDVDDAML